jgi:hypothetical protein
MMTPSNDSAISPSPNGADTVLVIRVDVASLAQQIATHLARELMSVVASPSPWLDVDRAAEHLSCSPERLRKLVSRRHDSSSVFPRRLSRRARQPFPLSAHQLQ